MKNIIDLKKVFSSLSEVNGRADLFIDSISPSEGGLGLHGRKNKYKESRILLDVSLREKGLEGCVDIARQCLADLESFISSAVRIKNLSAERRGELSSLRETCQILSDVLSKYNPLNGNYPDIEEVKAKVRALMEEQERHDIRHQKRLSENAKSISELELKVSNISESVGLEFKKVEDVYAAAMEEVEQRKDEINKILGLVSGNAVAGSFEESAKSERRVADIMRWVSVFFMVVFVLVASISLYFTLAKDFDWRTSTFNLIFAVLLSAPSAYFARESAKHRLQYNKHLQLSLELKAINPYIASLPAEEQHRIKSEIAGRMFCVRDDGVKLVEPYPINIQEILMEILKKVEIKGKA
ncbi:hypothetical protein SAMN05216575_103233 [Ectopseudomonas alcaliphila]|nr:hypothetical protein SAMN05216575_103233 [Pseudomonas alcaliphila]